MKKPLLEVKPGEALVNVLATFPELDWLRREFDMLYFLDLCAGLDALAVHETLVFTGPIKPLSSEINPIADALFRNNTLQRISVSSNDPMGLGEQLLATPDSREIRSQIPNTLRANELSLDSAFAAHAIDLSVSVAFEELLEIPLVLWAHASPLYLRQDKVRRERHAFRVLRETLAERYRSLSRVWETARRKADPDDIVQLPPLAFEALTSAEKLSDLPTVALEIREKYRKVRKRFAELDEYLASKDVSPQKKLAEAYKIEKSFDDLHKTNRADALATFISLPFRFLEFLNFGEIGDAAENPGKAIDWPKFAGKLAEWLATGIRRMHVRPLYATRKRYLTTPSKAMYDAVRRHFGHELCRDDLERAQKYSALLTRIRRSS